MKKAILATKIGMTQIFAEDGELIPVTVLQAGPCEVTQVKTVENDGYSAVQVGFQDMREKLSTKPMKGHFEKAGVSVKRFVREFKLDDAENYELGQKITVDVFEAGDKVDATAISKVKVFRELSRDMDSIQVLRHMVLNTIVMQDQTVWHLTHPR